MKKIVYQRIDWVMTPVEVGMTQDEILAYKKETTPNLTPRQIRLALIQSWISISAIDSIIDSLPEPQQSIVRTMREYSLDFERYDPILVQFAGQLWLSDNDIDNLFILWSNV